MDTKIDVDGLVGGLADVLDRAEGGERFVIERNGRPIATLAPPPKPDFTWGEFIALMNTLPWPDEDFAADLEAIQASQTRTSPPAWPD